jgi:hypothetical protein
VLARIGVELALGDKRAAEHREQQSGHPGRARRQPAETVPSPPD